ncbi:MAG: glycosyltransferase family 4 protein [Bacteroidales bacterium]|nr:glycosyltransferase family 4 protein [Bacteroidales bacterium]
MNILLINHYAGSDILGMEYRPYYLSREWVMMGHNVTILAASFAHIRSIQIDVKRNFQEDIHEGIRYVWIKTPKYEGNGFGRTRNMFTFIAKLWVNAKKISTTYKPDLVIASSTYPSDNYPAHRIAKISSAKYIYEVHDLWPLSPMELGGMSKNHPFIRMMQHGENYAYRHADKVISILPKTKEYMQSHGLDPENWHYIPNGICDEEWENTTDIEEKTEIQINKIRSEGNKLIAYTGSIGIANALDNFILAAEQLSNKKIAFFIVGHGPEKDRLIRLCNKKKLSNVYFLKAVPKRSIPKLLDMFDILYIGLQRQPLFRFGISPNKLIDYMMSGKVVIQAIDAGNDIVGEAGCGISIEAENPEKLIESILELVSKSNEELLQIGTNGKAYVLQNHLYSKLAKDFIDVI